MNFTRSIRTWGLWLLLTVFAFALVPSVAVRAEVLPEATRQALVQVQALREANQPAEAVKALEAAAENAPRQSAAADAVQLILADVYSRDLNEKKRAAGIYSRLAMASKNGGPVEIPGYGDGAVNIQHEALKAQDEQNHGHWLYRFMSAVTGVISDNPVTGRSLAGHSGVLAILLLTIVIKVALTPLTKKSFHSMREMQKLQPLMKELQQRYKDKPAELQKQTMALYQEHGVNPLSGCLPMLLQMPIIILLWRAIALYQYPLSQESFLWIPSLAMADTLLALLYAISLLASSKLTMMPTADPQQMQQQKMMAYMMPVMFFFLFKGYASGFILGWLFFNILTTAQQWHLMRGVADSDSSDRPQGSGPSGGGGGGGVPRRPTTPGNGAQGKAKKANASSRSIKRKRNMAAYQRGR